MITKEQLEKFQPNSKNGLRYEHKNEAVLIYNKLNEKIAELNLAHLKQGIYNDAWFGFVTGDEYKEIMDGAYLYYFSESKCSKKMCNTLGLEGGMEPETSEWFNNQLVPKLLDAGLKYNAIIIPENIFAQQTMEDFEANLGNKLARLFPNEQEATNWLISVN
jgi:hypothetical protein